jgi:hypothetical protein
VSLRVLTHEIAGAVSGPMDIAFLMRIAAAGLLLSLPVHGQNQNTPSQSLTQASAQEAPSPGIQQQIPSPPAGSRSTELKESFSQLTLFLFGSGLALFIALLGWSDQIRGFDNYTKELEQRFLDKTGIKKRDFLDIVRPKSPDEQLDAFARVDGEGRVNNPETIEVLRTFSEKLQQLWSRVERLSNWKYKLTIALTIILFLTGIISLFTNPTQQIPLYVVSVRSEMIILILPVLLIGLLLVIIIRSARWERDVRSILQSMADKV